MVYVSNYVDADVLDDATRADILSEYPVHQGVLLTEGTEAVKILAEAFPKDGYMIDDAYALRDLILKFNAERGLTPTVL